MIYAKIFKNEAELNKQKEAMLYEGWTCSIQNKKPKENGRVYAEIHAQNLKP